MPHPTRHTGPAQGRPIALALSGGVDSAVAATMLLEQGYTVIGVTMHLFDSEQQTMALRDAAAVASKLGIAHHIMDVRSAFRDLVTAPFIAAYRAGQTPSPCTLCNKQVKFGALYQWARQIAQTDLFATGHYARIVQDHDNTYQIHRGQDPARDQSYFLYAIGRDLLPYLRFPLGDYTKTQIRARAAHYGLNVAEKPDSQDICFIPGGNYAAYIDRHQSTPMPSGPIIDEQGSVLGTHQGLYRYTVGQRRGLALGARKGENNAPLYVVALDSARHCVRVGPRESLATQTVDLHAINWMDDQPIPPDGLDGAAQIRSAHKAAPARMMPLPDGGARLFFASPVYGAAPGQAGVFYQGTRLMGGGVISPPQTQQQTPTPSVDH